MKNTMRLALVSLAVHAAAATTPRLQGSVRSWQNKHVALASDGVGLAHSQEPAVPDVPVDALGDKVSVWMAAAAVGGGLVLGALIASAVVYFSFKGKDESEDKTEEAAEETQEIVATGAPGEDKPVDYEEMLRLLAKRVSEACNPQVAKGQAMKRILETRAENFTGKAKAFVMNELNGTASALMQALESEESALLLDMDSAIASYFPPLSVLLAGLLSPTILAFSYWNHIAQVAVVHLPMLLLCLWASYEDWTHECFGIPTIYTWIYCQAVVAGVLVTGHLVLAMKVKSGQDALKERSEAMRCRLESAKQHMDGEGMGLSDVRELFVCSSVLLQQALLAEEQVRRSFFNNVVGIATLASLIMTAWDIVLVFGWATVPGQLAFHPAAKAVVKPEDFCGAWASIIVLRVACLLSTLFVLFNMFEAGQWFADRALHSEGYTSGMMKKAQKFDGGNLGIPVAQTLVKAFLLRTEEDLSSAQLAVASNDRDVLQRERAELKSKIDSLEVRIGACTKEFTTLQEIEQKHGGKDDLEVHIQHLENFGDDTLVEWKTQGAVLVDKALEKNSAYTSEACTAELEKMMTAIQDVAQQIQDSEMYNQAVEQGTAAATATAEAAASAADAAQQAATQAVEAADQAMKSEAVQKALSQAKEGASAAAAKASEGLEKAKDTAAQASKK